MGIFGATHVCGAGGGGAPLPQNLSHISDNDETWHSSTLSKEDPKKYESRATHSDFC